MAPTELRKVPPVVPTFAICYVKGSCVYTSWEVFKKAIPRRYSIQLFPGLPRKFFGSPIRLRPESCIGTMSIPIAYYPAAASPNGLPQGPSATAQWNGPRHSPAEATPRNKPLHGRSLTWSTNDRTVNSPAIDVLTSSPALQIVFLTIRSFTFKDRIR